MDLMSYLACPDCGGSLNRDEISRNLTCSRCGKKIESHGGIYYCGETLNSEKANKTIDEFGKRWSKVYNRMGGLTSFLLPMIEPVKRDFFRDKIIVDAGGGFGRLSKILLDYGARHVVLLDASDAVLAAKEYLSDYLDKVTIIKCNLIMPPLAEGVFDVFFCHGVLHHSGEPEKAIQRMSRTVAPDKGSMILWVYAKEGNRVLSRMVKFVGLFSKSIGDWGRWRLSATIDILLWMLVKILYYPLIAAGISRKRLWYGEYFSEFLFNSTINNRMDRLQMYHDFLTTEIIEYYSKPQLATWANEAGYRKVLFYHYRKQSWSVIASFNPWEDFSGK